MKESQGFKDLKVYQMAYKLAMGIFKLSKSYPREEMYSLTDQIRRSSRSVCGNIAEVYRKRLYPKHFTSKITDAEGEASETIVWLDFSKDYGYILPEGHNPLIEQYNEVRKNVKWDG